MTVSEIKLGMNQGSTTYGPFSYGSYTGEPVVDFVVSNSDINEMPIQSIDSMLDGWSWKRKISSGFARLQFSGSDIFEESKEESISELSRLLDARFVDFEVKDEDLYRKPGRSLQNKADYYRVFVPKDYDFDDSVFEFYAEQSNRFGNVEFLFKVDSVNDEDYVRDIVGEYNIYDSDIWLFPKGRKARTVSERMEDVSELCKSNTWNVSPRLGIMMNAQEEIHVEE